MWKFLSSSRMARAALLRWNLSQRLRPAFLSTSPKPVSSSTPYPSTDTTTISNSSWNDILSPSRFIPNAEKKGLTIGILRETYDDWERRVPLTPHHVKKLLETHNHRSLHQVLVQPSPQRCFPNREYEAAGAILSDDLSQADVILGVKRPRHPDTMFPNKTYLFFSHVIKGQESNMGLLQTILNKNIQLIDYECIVQDRAVQLANGTTQVKPERLVAFGKYAGLAGMIDTFYPLGRRLVTDYGIHTPFLQCPPAMMQRDLAAAKTAIRTIGEQIALEGLPPDMDPLVFCVTGNGGKVYSGAMEILKLLPHETLAVDDLPELFQQQDHVARNKIHVVNPTPEDMYQHCTDGTFDRNAWKASPGDYESLFARKIAPYIQVLVNCIYWDPRYARLLTKNEMQMLHEEGVNRLLVVSDISCDVNGSIEFLDRTCTVDKPFFQYNPLLRKEVAADIGDKGITVMGTDILPAELPRESSEHFGNAVSQVLGNIMNDNQATFSVMDRMKRCPLLSRATITTEEGQLTGRYRYLDSFLQRASYAPMGANQTIDVMMQGHLFDSGFINTLLDAAEHLQCAFKIVDCSIDRAVNKKDEFSLATCKSIALLRFFSEKKENLNKLEKKIEALTNVMDKADASYKIVDRHPAPQKAAFGGNGSTRKMGTATLESQAEKKVLVLGSGRVSMSLVDFLGRTEEKHIRVASNLEEEARDVAKLAKRGEHVALDLNDKNALTKLVKGQDIVISLLPAPMHPLVAQECIAQKINFVTASYESPAMKEMNDRAKEAGIIIVNEVGLDPGLDHMSAMKVIDDVQGRGGFIRSFKSVCGGLPAPEAANNPLKYKFSWSPKGVLTASQNAARFRWENELVEIDGPDLMQSAKPFHEAWPDMSLEILPNRDSIKYETVYSLPNVETIFRGTLRFSGFSELMGVFLKMGLCETIPAGGQSWEDAFATLRKKAGSSRSMEDFLLKCARDDQQLADRAKDALRWLEMEGVTKLTNDKSIIDSFCAVLEQHMEFGPEERDMVAMHTAIEATFDDGRKEMHQSSMLAFGDEKMSAMCKTVGVPAAAAADLIMSGDLDDFKGLVLPTDKRVYQPILDMCEKEGISFEETVDHI